jgi:hypothetical protein
MKKSPEGQPDPERAAAWLKGMNKMFKGIMSRPTRNILTKQAMRRQENKR